MKYALYGIGGVYNYGCEAIVRGAVRFLRDIDSAAEIRYYSFNNEYDEQRLKDLGIEITSISKDKSIFKRGLNKGLRMLNANNQAITVRCDEMINNNDCIVSIGGDIYTIPQKLREKKRYPYHNELIEVGKRAITAGKRIIVYGASIGPFGDYKPAIDYYINNLKKYDLIICRERESIKYLNGFGMDNITFLPDPAFFVHEKTAQYSIDRPYVGVNFSPLSFNEIYGINNSVDYHAIAKLINQIKIKTGKKILLIPHVVAKDKFDDDFRFLKNLEVLTDADIADTSRGFLGVKAQLQKCCMVVSARMHCCVNAIVENVPTIFISYSQKSIGMCDFVYGNDKWVVELKNIDNDLISKIEDMFNHRDNISHYLERRNKEIQECYEENLNVIKSRLEHW